MGKIDWKAVVPEAIRQAQAYMNEYRTAPTLRGIYYRLVSVEAIPNTKGAYRGLSGALTKARLRGVFPWRLMVDNVRQSTDPSGGTTLDNVEYWASTEVRDHLSNLERAFEKIENPHVNFRPSVWAAQEKRVILAIEKDAILGAVQDVTSKLDVQIFPLRGYSSTTFMKTLADRVKLLSQEGQVQLLLVTDYDPSGEDIARDVQDRLLFKFGAYCETEKILLTKPQIVEHNLPAIPDDAEEISKMMRDPRWNKWEDGIFRVELDAMAAIEAQSFREIITEAIEKHLDRELYEEQQEKAREFCDQAEEDLRELYEKLAEVHLMVKDRIGEIQEES